MGYNIYFVFIIGLVSGSFLNMLIYRLPLSISLFNPKRSICPKCKTTLKWYENIPLLSYIFLGAKCSTCKTAIPSRYFFVELLTAVCSVLLYQKIGYTIEFLILTLILYLLILLSFIDLEYKAVPDYLLILISIVTLLYLFLFDQENIKFYFMFAGAIVTIELFVTYYIQNIKSYLLKDPRLKTQKAMGEGDIPIIALIGGVLGLQFGMIAIFLSAIFAIIPALINIVIKKEIETPFIPFLSLGFFITFIYEKDLENILKGLF